MLSVTAWADELKVSRSTDSPEFVYNIHGGKSNSSYYWGEAGKPVSGAASAVKFAFYKGAKDGQYYIYDITNKKYLSYDQSNISSGANKVTSSDTKSTGTLWRITTVTGSASYYQVQPLTSDDNNTVSGCYANWYEGPAKCTESMGLWTDDGQKDGGSSWAFVLVAKYPYVSTSVTDPEVTYNIHGGWANSSWYWGALGACVTSESAVQFAFYKADTDGQFYIYDVTNKKYLSYAPASVAAEKNQVSNADDKTSAYPWVISYLSSYPDYFEIQPVSTNETTLYANWNGGASASQTAMGLWSDSGSKDGGSSWAFDLAGGKDVSDITYTLTTTDGESFTGTLKGFAGEDIHWTGASALTFSDETWTDAAYSAKISCADFPFSSEKTKNYRYIGIKSSSDRLLSASDDKIVMSYNVFPTNENGVEDKYEWAIIPSVEKGVFSFKVLNKTGKYISTEGVTAASSPSESSYVKLADTGTALYYGACTGSGRGFYVPSTSNFISINSPGQQNQTMFLWSKPSSSGHEGSNLGFYTPADFSALMLKLATAKEAAEKIELSTELGKYCATETFTNAKTEAASVSEGTKFLTASAFETLINNLSTSALSVNVPQSGKFYTFKCVTGDRYILSTMSTTNSKRLAVGTESGSKEADRIFYFDNTSLVGYNNGYYLAMNDETGGFLTQAAASSTSGTKFSFSSASVDEGSLCVNFNDNGRGLYGNTDGCVNAGPANCKDNGYRFYVTEVTSLPLTIGANGWSSFSAPVAVSVPSEVTAYYAPNDPADNKLVLEEITNGIIPANTGVVIKGTEGATVNFSTNITGTATALSNNKLVCNWCANKIGTEESTNTTDGLYAFATKTSGSTKTTGFMKLLTEITLLGHKCYLNAATAASPSTGSAQFIPISLTDDPTGIESAETTTVSDSDAPIYDLQGRKVNGTKKGGMYIQNGKVFIAM